MNESKTKKNNNYINNDPVIIRVESVSIFERNKMSLDKQYTKGPKS